MAKVKRYRPFRVINPTAECHSARLHPCQSMVIKLRHPFMFLEGANKDSKFSVELSNVAKEFLIVEKTEHDIESGDYVLIINQKYDLTSWSKQGEVFLGNIIIKCDDFKYSCHVCVVLTSDKKNLITVVNPIGDVVRIYPHQTVEVVVFEASWNDWEPGLGRIEASGLRDRWTWKPEYLNARSLEIEQAKYEIVGDRGEIIPTDEGIFTILNRHKLFINPRVCPHHKQDIEREIRNKRKPVREHHFWLNCSHSTTKKLFAYKDGTYDLSFLGFEGVCRCDTIGGESTVWRGLDLKLAVRGKKSQMHPFNFNPDSIEHKMEVSKRSEDKLNSVLANPLAVEMIEFVQGQKNSVYIEIVQPSVLWNDLGDDVRWEVTFDETHHRPKSLKIMPLGEYCRWGRTFQRFCITHVHSLRGNDSEFLGAIFLTCLAKKDSHDGRKRISFWLHREDKNNASQTRENFYSHVPNHSKKHKHCETGHYRDGPGHYRGTARVCTVSFEEVIDSTLEGSARTIKYGSIWTHNTKSSGQSLCNGDFYTKKKADSLWASNLLEYHSDEKTKRQKEKGTENETRIEKKNGSITNGERESTSTHVISSDDRPVLVVCNPNHKERIPVDVGQSILIKMSSPEKLIGARYSGEFWTVIPNGSFKCLTRVISYSEAFCQEVQVDTRQIPPAEGTHLLGSIKFECSAETREVLIECQVDNRMDVKFECSTDRLAVPLRYIENQGGKRSFVREWKHGDSLILSPTDHVFISTPLATSCWGEKSWSMLVEQQPIPKTIWNNPLVKDIVDKVDVYNPWFPTKLPLQLNTTYLFRSLANQQPYVNLILQALADQICEDIYPIAKITFTNRDYPGNINVNTPYGVLATEHTLSRSLTFCVDLSKFRSTVIKSNPGDEEEIEVKADQVLKIKLPPTYVTDTLSGKTHVAPWYMLSNPDFLQYIDSEESGLNGDRIFKFRAKEGDSDWLRFSSGKSVKRLLVKVCG